MKQATIPETTWYVYALTPIDFGWDRLTRVPQGEIPEPVRWTAQEMHWEGDFTQGPVRFFVPNEESFAEGFAWKQGNNGTTFVACTMPLPHLDAHSVG